MNKQEIQVRVNKIQWFHNYEIIPGIMSGGVSNMLERGGFFEIPQDLTGKRVLDIGCADGYFTFLAESRGASVVSIDSWPRQGYFLAHELRGSKAEFYQMSVYDINPEKLGLFDIVFFFGVYYHLKNPILALERIASVVKDYVIVESEIMKPLTATGTSESAFYEQDELNGDPTNYWVPSVPAFIQTIRSAGFPRAELVTVYHQRRGVVKAYKGPYSAAKALNEDYFVVIDTPQANQTVSGQVHISGWAVSQLDPEEGIERVVLFLDNLDDPTCELGQAETGIWRGDQIPHFGNRYGPCGYQFTWDTTGVPRGEHTLYVMAVGKYGWHYRSRKLKVR